MIRVQDRPQAVVETRAVSADGRAARVVSDEVVTPCPGGRSRSATPGHPIRRIVIAGRDRGRWQTDRANPDPVIRMANRLDLPAEVLAAKYPLRWSIELFFRFRKPVLGCNRRFSGKPEGVAIQVYVSLIAALPLARATGGRVTGDMPRLFQLDLPGWADETELLAGLERLRRKERLKEP
ncbi:MAG TPA: transposase [Urbifossiella sp.]|nr:transposase [Urbifossiella sp.]